MSEAITNQLASTSIQAKSAGSQPVGEVHPLSIRYLNETGFSTAGLKSESWDDFEGFKPDVVITVCDSAAGEACPVYFDNSLKLHWGLRDPSKVKGEDLQIKQAFIDCIEEIKTRVKILENIANQNLDKDELKVAINNIQTN